MTTEREVELIKGLDSALMVVLEKKRADYGTVDVLSNFKRLSEVAKHLNIDVKTSLGYTLFMVLMKIDRINNLVSSNKIPNNESIEDSFGDGINYFKLAYCVYMEGIDQKVTDDLPW